jgi:hypothetical protein
MLVSDLSPYLQYLTIVDSRPITGIISEGSVKDECTTVSK